MEALRVQGNALFTAKQYTEAMAKYSEALALGDGDLSAADAAAQRLLLWSNRAACALPLNRFDDAVADCTRALDVDPQNEKARYRRAQAFVGLTKYTQAFQDVRLVLAANPNNKAVVALARKIKDVVQRDVNGLQKALDAVAKGTEQDIVTQRTATEEALTFLDMKCAQELASVPRELDEKGGITILWRAVKELLEVGVSDAKVSTKTKDAAEALLARVVGLLAVVASASLPLAATVFNCGGELLTHLLTLLHTQIQQSYTSSSTSGEKDQRSTIVQKPIVKLAAFVFKHLMLASDDDAAIRSVLKGLLDGLRSRDVELQICGLDGLLHFVSTATATATDSTGTGNDVDAITQRKKRFGTLVHEVGLFPLLHETAAIALHLSSAAQPRYDVLLSRLPLVFTQCLAQLEANESILQTLVRDYCAAPVIAASAHDRTLLEKASASCLLLSALFLSNAKLALWAVQQTGNDGTLLLGRLGDFLVASRLFDDARPRTRRFQEIWVDCVASVCGVENGTACVPATLRVEIYKMLRAALDDDDLVLRASALSIQIKIAVVEKAFDTDSADSHFLIAQVFEVLEKAYDSTQSDRLSGASPTERGIEALSYVITLTTVKDAFVQHPKAIQSVFDVDFKATGNGYRANVYYGIGYILHHVLTSEATLKKKQMEGMELTPDQYEELQKALRQKSVLDDGDSPANVQLRVTKLVHTPHVLTTLVHLLKFATTQSMNVLDMAVQSALYAADVADVRGKLVQSGVFQSLLPLAMHALAQTDALKKKKNATTPGKKSPVTTLNLSIAAGHAIAKILISTNPNLVSSASLLSSIRPLLELCKGDTQLQQFEALMALTNIASLSDETKNRILSEPQGLSTLQYLQFSEHELVRRAATEAICNLLPHPQIIEKIFLNEEKIRLWLAFASVEEEQEDFETARAAAGALAMVSQVPQVSWLLLDHGALQAFTRVLTLALHEDTVHRALFAMENLLATLSSASSTTEQDDKEDKEEEDKPTKAERKQQYLAIVKTELQETLLQSLKTIAVGGKHAPPTREAAQSCLAALIQCLKE